MSGLTVQPTGIAGVMQVSRLPWIDERGCFSRLFDHSVLAAAGWPDGVAQVNLSVTRHAGTVRGLHYQHPPHAEAKLVSCIRGRVFDVAVDLRAGSSTFGAWHAAELSAENCIALLIPPGCAHGFQALSDDATLVYCHSAPWVAAAEAGISVHDPSLAIAWPLPVTGLSRRDAALPALPVNFPRLET